MVRESENSPMAQGYLVLEDGTLFEGELFGACADAVGEVVFETNMSGYQEGLTDPSYEGQILVMTYPLIGNYGIVDDYTKSSGIHVRAVVVREFCKDPSPMYSGGCIDEYLKNNGVPGISGIDTRELVIKIRNNGTMKGAIVSADADVDKVVADLKASPASDEENLVAKVSCKEVTRTDSSKDVTVGLLDCGAESWIAKALAERFNVVTFPYDTSADTIRSSGISGLVVSNGPGNPAHPAIMETVVPAIRELSDKMPIFGIGLGAQVTALAMGAKTYKLKFGHRGGNQPVRCNGRVHITTQNHGYSIDEGSLEGTGLVVNQVNLFDNTVEGVEHGELPIFATQYHPMASPGAWDEEAVFDKFASMIEGVKF